MIRNKIQAAGKQYLSIYNDCIQNDEYEYIKNLLAVYNKADKIKNISPEEIEYLIKIIRTEDIVHILYLYRHNEESFVQKNEETITEGLLEKYSLEKILLNTPVHDRDFLIEYFIEKYPECYRDNKECIIDHSMTDKTMLIEIYNQQWQKDVMNKRIFNEHDVVEETFIEFEEIHNGIFIDALKNVLFLIEGLEDNGINIFKEAKKQDTLESLFGLIPLTIFGNVVNPVSEFKERNLLDNYMSIILKKFIDEGISLNKVMINRESLVLLLNRAKSNVMDNLVFYSLKNEREFAERVYLEFKDGNDSELKEGKNNFSRLTSILEKAQLKDKISTSPLKVSQKRL